MASNRRRVIVTILFAALLGMGAALALQTQDDPAVRVPGYEAWARTFAADEGISVQAQGFTSDEDCFLSVAETVFREHHRPIQGVSRLWQPLAGRIRVTPVVHRWLDLTCPVSDVRGRNRSARVVAFLMADASLDAWADAMGRGFDRADTVDVLVLASCRSTRRTKSSQTYRGSGLYMVSLSRRRQSRP